jgi:hypothetical protein
VSLASKREELEQLHKKARALEVEIAAEEQARNAQTLREYPAYHATMGCLLGIFGAAVSLLFNVIGALVAGKNPFELIRVYLTFPLGENALRLTDQAAKTYALSDSVIVAFGCCLYLLTGMLLGIPVALVLGRFAPRGSLVTRLIVAGVAALVIWVFNFYAILSWLQPLLFGGHWIVDQNRLPWWVAAATHLVFGATIAVLYPLVLVQAAPARVSGAGS